MGTARLAQKALNKARKEKSHALAKKEKSDKQVAKAQKQAETVTVAATKTKLLKQGASIAKKLFKQAIKKEKHKIKAAAKAVKGEGLDPVALKMKQLALKQAHDDLAKAEKREVVVKATARAKVASKQAKHVDDAIIASQKAAVEQAQVDAKAAERIVNRHHDSASQAP